MFDTPAGRCIDCDAPVHLNLCADCAYRRDPRPSDVKNAEHAAGNAAIAAFFAKYS